MVTAPGSDALNPSSPAAEQRSELSRDAQVRIDISRDGLTAVAEITPARGGGRRLELSAVQSALLAAGVREGIRTEQITSALALQDKGGRFEVASGRPPVHGTDGYIDFRFNRSRGELRPVELEDGSVDYYNLQTVTSVEVGQVLAERVPPTGGIPGVSVIGEPIPAKPGRDAKLLKGKNVDMTSDGNALKACIAGQVMLEGAKVSVLALHEIRGDVDFSTGNIDFVGSVTIYGSVKSGFTIRAGGNVEIRGSVDAANVIAGGDVSVLRGVQGGERGQIIAGGNVTARFLQQATVKAGHDVEVAEALMYCDVQAGGKVTARGSKGRIVGGVIRACESVSARVIGSRLATKTEVEVGVTPEIRTEFNKVQEDLSARLKQADQVNKGLQSIRNAHAVGRNLTANDAVLVKQLADQSTLLKEEIANLEARKEELEQVVVSAGRGQVRALDVAHAGIKITIGHLSMYVNDDIAKSLFYISEGEIRVGTA